MNKNCFTVIISSLLLFSFCSCKKDTNKVAKIEIPATIEILKKEYNFGEITMTDSIVVSFYIKNISDIPLLITKVGTSCGCTTSEYTKDEVMKNENATINVVFKPNDTGFTEKSIVVESNTEPPFNVFYLKGQVTE